MGLGTVIGGIFSKGATDLAGAAFNGLDELITSKEEIGQINISLEEIKSINTKNRMDFQLKGREIEFKIADQEYKDRESAREMYMKDSSLQKIFAIVFLISYVLISAGMIAMVISMAFYNHTIDLPDWGVMLISSVFTAMSSKVSSITDFLFGGSKGKDDSDARSAQAFKGSQG